jgi:hypothetical protein
MRLSLLILTLSFTVLAGPSDATEKRVALVFGVGAYRNVPGLTNPTNDARLIAPLLEKLGFEMDLVIDPDHAQMEAAIRRFGTRINGATATVFYYAGHGLQVAGRNYLLPVDANITREADLPREAFDLQSVLDQLDASSSANLIFLDACRDNPLSQILASRISNGSTQAVRGLAPEERTAAVAMIAYATDPNDVALDGQGSNSPFTEALAKYIPTPGLEVNQVMIRVKAAVRVATGGRQHPWDNSNLDRSFYFVPPDSTSASAPGTDAATEAVFWTSIQPSSDVRDFEEYLRLFPNGKFAVLAMNALERIRHEASLVPPSTGNGSDRVLATVGGEAIRMNELNAAFDQLPPQVREAPRDMILPRLLDQMVDSKALAIEARGLGIDHDPAVRSMLQRVPDADKERVLISALLEREVAPRITDAAIRARFDADANKPGVEEVRARHILVDDETTARKIIAALGRGDDFVKLSNQYNRDSAAMAQGGDLGFFKFDDMVPEFSKVSFALADNEIAPVPVHTQFGWHVVQTLQHRAAPAATFEAVRDKLRGTMINEEVHRIVARARAGVRVERFNLDGSLIRR